MANPLYSSSDVPDYSTYPDSRVTAPPEAGTPLANPRFEEVARTIGGAIGRAVAEARHRTEFVRMQAAEAKDELRASAEEIGEDLRATTEQKLSAAGQRVREVVRDAKAASGKYPLHVIAGAGVVGLAIGIGLRVWKEQRAYTD